MGSIPSIGIKEKTMKNETQEVEVVDIPESKWLEALKFSPYWLRNKLWDWYDTAEIVSAGVLIASPVIVMLGIVLVLIIVGV